MPVTITQNVTQILCFTDSFVFTIAKANARGDSLTVQNSVDNLIAAPMSFVAYHDGSQWRRANSATYTPTNSFGGRLTFGFATGIQATFRAQASSTHLLFELLDIGNPATIRRIIGAHMDIDGEEYSDSAGIIYKQVRMRDGETQPFVISDWRYLSKQCRLLGGPLTEQNADAIINYALKGKFKYIMPYAGTWAQAYGHYQLHSQNYPLGLRGLRMSPIRSILTA